MGMPWGGFPPKESKLEEVETGAGKIFNSYFFPHIEKAVIRTPMVADNHILKPNDFPDPQANLDALKFFVEASVAPLDVDVKLSMKDLKMVSKLEHLVSYHDSRGETEEATKITKQIQHIWDKAHHQDHHY